MTDPKLENTPCPTPSRAIYGFVLYVVSYVLYGKSVLLNCCKNSFGALKNILFVYKIFFFLGAYILWALLPDSWLADVGITYIPAR